MRTLRAAGAATADCRGGGATPEAPALQGVPVKLSRVRRCGTCPPGWPPGAEQKGTTTVNVAGWMAAAQGAQTEPASSIPSRMPPRRASERSRSGRFLRDMGAHATSRSRPLGTSTASGLDS